MQKVTRKNQKSGFSLAEALITLLLISLCVVLSVPAIVKKFEKKREITHGIWECSDASGGYLQEERNLDGEIKESKVVSSCRFSPSGGSDFHVEICSGSCALDDGSRVYMYYPQLGSVTNITSSNFGGLVYSTGGYPSRVTVIY
jgi:hypothetical protein